MPSFCSQLTYCKIYFIFNQRLIGEQYLAGKGRQGTENDSAIKGVNNSINVFMFYYEENLYSLIFNLIKIRRNFSFIFHFCFLVIPQSMQDHSSLNSLLFTILKQKIFPKKIFYHKNIPLKFYFQNGT